MTRYLRIFGWTIGAITLAALLAAGAVYLWLRGSLPVTSGTLPITAITAGAEIVRDSDGLVHIHADSVADAYVALGYAHAQDRLWQMEATRRLGTGRLAEIGGRRFLAQDRLMRTLGIGRLAESSLAQLSPEARAVVDAYSRGVNAWIAGHRGALPPEFALLGHRPEPWRPADCLIWGRLMALALSGNWRRQLDRLRLAQRLSPDALDRLSPPYPTDALVTVSADARAAVMPHSTPRPKDDRATTALAEALADVLPPPPAADGASNGWLVAGAHSASGKPLLANDPHLGFRAPNLWYLVRIEAPGLMLAGATTPGVPFHILGHNGRIAWGMTTTGADSQDVVIEHIAPGDGTRYRTPSGLLSFTRRKETLRIRGAAPETLEIRKTRNGPVMSDLVGDVARQLGAGTVLALRSPVLASDDATAEALFRINRAGDWAAFTAALAHFHSPVQNLFYADVAGHIGFSVAGRMPVRRGRDSRTLADGARADHNWAGFIAPAALPRSFDPARGILVNANNRVVGAGYPYELSRNWEAPYRAMRIEQVLAGGGKQTVATTGALQRDELSLAARDLMPALMRQTTRSAGNAALLDRLQNWDSIARRDGPEALIFTTWMARLTLTLFGDDLGPQFDGFARLRPLLLAAVLNGDTAWCDDTRTTDRSETCAEAFAASLDAAGRDLAARYGTDVAAWRWGAAHRAVFRNPALDWLPLIGPLTRITIATGGDDFTVNRGTSTLRGAATDFDHVHGPTLRAIYDMSDPDAALFAVPGGQSGNPLSRHYRDLTRRWRDGATVTLRHRPDGALERLRLVPAPPPRS